MAPSSKSSDSRRKSGAKPSLTITLTVKPSRLREMISPASGDEKSPTAQETKDVKEGSDSKESPATPNALAASVKAGSNGDNASDSNAATPAAEGTPAPSAMGPPTEGAKKKGTKRSATGEGNPRQRGKPGPKKKARLDDGTDHAGTSHRPSGGHKLGPKANQGAINAGLRALDRSGKPCRKWNKGSFKLKSFTGVVWEIPRWTAPPRRNPEPSTEDSAAPSAESSNKENSKENGNEGNSMANSNSGADVEMTSVISIQVSSPAPIPVAAAS